MAISKIPIVPWDRVNMLSSNHGQPNWFSSIFFNDVKTISNTTQETTESFRQLSAVQTAISEETRKEFASTIRKNVERHIEEAVLGPAPKEKAMPAKQLVYPITVESVSLDHKGGTKSYHLKLVHSKSGNSLVIYRWGKTGEFGSVKVEKFVFAEEASKAFEKKMTEKMRKGYAVNSKHDPAPKTADDFADLRKLVGSPVMSKLQADELKHIDPDADTKGMREREDPRFTEDGKWDADAADRRAREKQAEIRKAQEEAKRKEEQEAQQAYANDPNFGAF